MENESVTKKDPENPGTGWLVGGTVFIIVLLMMVCYGGYRAYHWYRGDTPDEQLNALQSEIESSLKELVRVDGGIKAIMLRPIIAKIDAYFFLRTAYDSLGKKYSAVPPRYFYSVTYGRNGMSNSYLEGEIDNLCYFFLHNSVGEYSIPESVSRNCPEEYKMLDSLGLELNWRYMCLYIILQGLAGNRQIVLNGYWPYIRTKTCESSDFQSSKYRRLMDYRITYYRSD